MKFKIIGNSLIYVDEGHKIIEGENEYDTIEIEMPHYRDGLDLMLCSFRLTAAFAGNDNKFDAQILSKREIGSDKILLTGSVTSDFLSAAGKIIFTVTGTGPDRTAKIFSGNKPIKVMSDAKDDKGMQLY